MENEVIEIDGAKIGGRCCCVIWCKELIIYDRSGSELEIVTIKL